MENRQNNTRLKRFRKIKLEEIRPLSNVDIIYYTDLFGINFFRGVFMRDELIHKPFPIECGIVNTSASTKSGTHWIAYCKSLDDKYYFDPKAQTNPPIELQCYLGAGSLSMNADKIQRNSDPPISGHLCVLFLKVFYSTNNFHKAMDKMLKYSWPNTPLFFA